MVHFNILSVVYDTEYQFWWVNEIIARCSRPKNFEENNMRNREAAWKFITDYVFLPYLTILEILYVFPWKMLKTCPCQRAHKWSPFITKVHWHLYHTYELSIVIWKVILKISLSKFTTQWENPYQIDYLVNIVQKNPWFLKSYVNPK